MMNLTDHLAMALAARATLLSPGQILRAVHNHRPTATHTLDSGMWLEALSDELTERLPALSRRDRFPQEAINEDPTLGSLYRMQDGEDVSTLAEAAYTYHQTEETFPNLSAATYQARRVWRKLNAENASCPARNAATHSQGGITHLYSSTREQLTRLVDGTNTDTRIRVRSRMEVAFGTEETDQILAHLSTVYATNHALSPYTSYTLTRSGTDIAHTAVSAVSRKLLNTELDRIELLLAQTGARALPEDDLRQLAPQWIVSRLP